MTPKIFKSSRSYFRRKQLFFLSQLITPQGTHLISWATYLAGLEDKRGKVSPHLWFLDLQRRITIPDSNDQLSDQYFNKLPLSTLPSVVELQPCNPISNTLKRWIVTLDDYGLPVFGKQLAIQLARGTSNIVHWVDPFCVDSPGNIITLTPCPGCDAHTSLLIGNRNSTDPLPRYGSLINLGSPDVSMGWSWVQVVHDDGFYGSVASYAHGVIKDWPSSSRAEAAAIYAALTVTPPDSTVKICTDSQTAMDGLRSCALSSYMNGRLYYKTTNFELWAVIERLIISKRLNVLPIKVKAHSNDYLERLR
ncbi:unnamed protein product [Rhizophagus irregularis]|nr:unnamed protein product [Rhizophagus irregularis]